MNSTMGIILTGGQKEKLKELTLSRSVAALPIGGRYRVIDFLLSNMVNSGIHNVGIITQSNYHSLMDHLGTGKEWDLDRKKDGLFILPPYVTKSNQGWYRGTADALANNIPYIKKSTQDIVVLHGSNAIYNMNFSKAVEQHINYNADITILFKDIQFNDLSRPSPYGFLQLGRNERVIDIEEKPLTPKTTDVSMGIYILKRELLIDLLENSRMRGEHDWVRGVLIKNLSRLKMVGYEYHGYWKPIHSVQDYFHVNCDMLNTFIRDELFYGAGPIYTKIKDEVPARYKGEGRAINSIIADGAVIEGHVENSIVFRGVNIAEGAYIKNSILMQDTVIHQGVELHYTILDKEVRINKNKKLIGQENYPLVIPKKVVI